MEMLGAGCNVSLLARSLNTLPTADPDLHGVDYFHGIHQSPRLPTFEGFEEMKAASPSNTYSRQMSLLLNRASRRLLRFDRKVISVKILPEDVVVDWIYG